MEILIVGGILVALMVYVSTRIKRAAAAAYGTEIIETEGFRLTKPEGFLYPLKDDSEYSFEAYSKEFGEDEAAKFYQAQIFVKTHKDFAEANLNRVIESHKTTDGVQTDIFRKVLSDGENFYVMDVEVLNEYREKYLERINQLLDSFTLFNPEI